jgi:CHAT domain-containing protein
MDEGLLSYYHDNNTWQLFLLTPSEVCAVKLEIENLQKKVEDFRSKLINKGDYKALAKELYVQLIQPAEQELPQKKLPKKLTIVPFGVLHYLPFAALMPSDDEYLTQRYTLSILPSAALRDAFIPRPVSSRILAIGNPSRDGKATLFYAEKEAVMVADMARIPSPPLLRDQATKKEFLDSAPDYGIIHIACHGEFQPAAPLQSSLFLATTETDDGNLRVTDLFDVPQRWGAQIVVLSACKSSLVNVNPGQDVIGLQRGFLYAGTDSIIGTLWQIEDEATLSIMTWLYSYLKEGASGATALRLAQEESIRRKWDPKNWAAFTFTGLILEPDNAHYPSSLPKEGRTPPSRKPARRK